MSAKAIPAEVVPHFFHGRDADALVDDDAIARILKTVRAHLGLEIAYVARYVGEDREILSVDTDLDLPMGAGYREPKEDGYCWHVLQGRLPELIQDPADHPFTKTMAITDFLPVGAHLNVPLRLSDGTAWGSFCALSRKPDRSMTERDVGVMRAFAGLAAERIESTLEADVVSARLRNSIAQLLENEQITILQQPIHSLSENRPVGVECLARFPDARMRGPDAWFNEATEVGLNIELEMLAVRCALETLSHVPQGIYASINASPETILSGALDDIVREGSRETLVIELTEHQRVADYAVLGAALAKLSPHARIAIDDVGAGYSGLRHIVDLNPDLLKLDMSLTRDIHRDTARRALTGAMVRFAEEIGCKLVAEGVECAEERDMLASLGVDYGQGYFFARPLPVIAAQQHLLGCSEDGQSGPAQ